MIAIDVPLNNKIRCTTDFVAAIGRPKSIANVSYAAATGVWLVPCIHPLLPLRPGHRLSVYDWRRQHLVSRGDTPGTGRYLQRDYFIRAQEKKVLGLQFRFLERYPEIIHNAVESTDIRHATSSAQARLKLEVIGELKTKITAERADAGSNLEKQLAAYTQWRVVTAIHRLED